MVGSVDKDLRAIFISNVLWCSMLCWRMARSASISLLQRLRPVGVQRKSVEQGSQLYRAAFIAPNKDIWADAMWFEFQGLIVNDTFEPAIAPSGSRPIAAVGLLMKG